MPGAASPDKGADRRAAVRYPCDPDSFSARALGLVYGIERHGRTLEQLVKRLTLEKRAPVKDVVLPILARDEAKALFLDDARNLACHRFSFSRSYDSTAPESAARVFSPLLRWSTERP